jgi:TolB protein
MNISRYLTFRFFKWIVLAIALCATNYKAYSEVVIDINGVGAPQTPISVAMFQGNEVAKEFYGLIRSDLQDSGAFRLIPAEIAISETAPIAFESWRQVGVDALLTGSLQQLPDGRLQARFRLWDVVRQVTLDSAVLTGSMGADYRQLAHTVADRVLKAITGSGGLFTAKLAYVSVGSKGYQLNIGEWNGSLPQVAVLPTKEPLISPTFSPDGQKIAYVSFDSGKAVIVVQTLSTGQRTIIASNRGNSSAPSFANKSDLFSAALGKDGGTHVYLMNTRGENIRAVTSGSSINTEPIFAPDDSALFFVSDRTGGPQIYKVLLENGQPKGDFERVTFEGDYNISPRLSPNGKLLAYIARRDGRYMLAVLDLISRKEKILSEIGQEEAPTFAPNGRHFVVASALKGKGVLQLVSLDGSIKKILNIQSAGEVREPTFSK